MLVRASGVLLHMTSLPGRYGIGDLGPSAHAFARMLRELGQRYWQFLPLGPTSPAIGNSPYSSPSAFAGNPLLISPEKLVEDGYLSWADIGDGYLENAPSDAVQYTLVEQHRQRVLRIAFERNRHALAEGAFPAFTAQHAHWLRDYARFMTIKLAHGGAGWSTWPEPLKFRHHDALSRWDEEHYDDVLFEEFVQFLFYMQWEALRTTCKENGLRLVGDVPIYVTHDSADVWMHRHLFKLDEQGEPFFVAGVPPDYFSETGQRWGNPVFNWEAMAQEQFGWWIRRLAHHFDMMDFVRLDHFRGFAGYWEIPATEETAINGEWVDAPGIAFFTELAKQFSSLPLIAEDLGVITADVRELKALFNLPGMKILQFGFGGNLIENPDAPFNHTTDCVVYTGTHDNAPVAEWWAHESGDAGRSNFRQFAGPVDDVSVPNAFMRLAMASVARTAIFPVQDILGLGAESRMNTPSVANGNWEWRMRPEAMTPHTFQRFAEMTRFFGRWT